MTCISTLKQISWPHVVAEGLLIVISILLAFGIQAWWDGRSQAERRHALLDGLSADFAGAEAELDRAMIRHREVVEVTGRWIVMSRTIAPSPSLAAVADTLVSEMQWATTFGPPMGSVESLLAGGDMGLLESPALAKELTSWMAGVKSLNELEQGGLEQLEREVYPYLMDSGIPLADLAWTRRNVYPEYPIEPRHTDVYRLLADVGWESIVATRWYYYMDVMHREQPLRESIARIRRLIDLALDGGA